MSIAAFRQKYNRHYSLHFFLYTFHFTLYTIPYPLFQEPSSALALASTA